MSMGWWPYPDLQPELSPLKLRFWGPPYAQTCARDLSSGLTAEVEGQKAHVYCVHELGLNSESAGERLGLRRQLLSASPHTGT